MICIISGTNRLSSKTDAIARFYFREVKKISEEDVRFFSLKELPAEILHSDMYEKGGQSGKLTKIQDEIFIPSQKWIFIVPEYNGGVPGILKLLIDSLSIRKYKETFQNKLICLVGVSSGRAGNLRGLDYLTNVFHYLDSVVFPLKIPISRIESIVNDNGEITNEETKSVIKDQVQKFNLFRA